MTIPHLLPAKERWVYTKKKNAKAVMRFIQYLRFWFSPGG